MIKKIPTTLGVDLIRREQFWEIDLTQLKIFKGLSVLAKIIGDKIIDYINKSIGDVSFLYTINPEINPELFQFDVKSIQIYSKSGVLDPILDFREGFQDHLRLVFGTFQRPDWVNKIHPLFIKSGNDQKSKVLVFPLTIQNENTSFDIYFILEKINIKNQKDNCFFRLTIEDSKDYSLRKDYFEVVDDLKSRIYLAGSTKLSETLAEKIQLACKKGFFSLHEENLVSNHLFEQLSKTELGNLEQISFYWDEIFAKFMNGENQEEKLQFIKRIFLSLEDVKICEILKSGETIRLTLNNQFIFVYFTRRLRVLNFSVNLEKESLKLDYYLKRMPVLENLALKKQHSFDFSNINLFLIHHITSEILALIEAFRLLKVHELNVLFVKYAGVVPSSYLDAVLEIPERSFFSTSLVRTIDINKKEFFILSKAFSETSDCEKLKNYLEEAKLNFFEAMKFVSMHFFLKFCLRSYKEQKKVLLVEDGGYLSPLFNELSLQGKGLSEILKHYLVEENNFGIDMLSDFFGSVIIGSVEHTRNGYDRINKVFQNFQKLLVPVYSIAISKNKTIEESKEVAHSILSAIESILHGQGMVLSRRKTVIFGAKGNIGSFLAQYMIGGRLHETNQELIKVDHRFEMNNDLLEYSNLDEIPAQIFLNLELFLGVIGTSILKKKHIENLIVNGNAKNLIFASGSTKTEEFTDLSSWLIEQSSQKNCNVLGVKIEFLFKRIIDPQTGIDQGGLVHVIIYKNEFITEKKLFLLGDLSPINFLFYGVPTETMDSIISQLTSVSLGMTHQFKEHLLPKPGIYAVDHQIDEWGNLR